MKNFVFVLLVSTVFAYPLTQNEETGQEHIPIEHDADGQSDDQLFSNVEETKNIIDNDVQPEDIKPLAQPDDPRSLPQSDDLSPSVQQALDLNRNLQTNFKVENWHGGTVNTGLTIGTAYFISDVHCSGTQCSVRLT